MSDEAFPFMGVREGTLENAPVRIFRISFSGELAYEIYTTSDFGDALCDRAPRRGGGAGAGAAGSRLAPPCSGAKMAAAQAAAQAVVQVVA